MNSGDDKSMFQSCSQDQPDTENKDTSSEAGAFQQVAFHTHIV